VRDNLSFAFAAPNGLYISVAHPKTMIARRRWNRFD
jgi:hypothetical protein